MIIGFTFVIPLWIFKVKLWLIHLLFRLQVLPYKVSLHLLMVINLRNHFPTTLRILCKKKKNVKLSIYSFPCRYRIYFYNWNILYKHRNKYNIPSVVIFFKNVTSSLLLRSLVLAFLTSLKRLFILNGVICIKRLDLCVQTRLKLGKTYFFYLY